MENTQEPVVVNSPSSSAGGKIGIAIVVLVILIGALYFFSNRNREVLNSGDEKARMETVQANENTELNRELDAAATADIDADLRKMDAEFSQ